MSHVFISYSKKNRAYARTLANHLIELGFDVWIDDRIDYGDDWWRTIVRAIRTASAFIVIMTNDSDASEWVQREVTLADKHHIAPFPVWLADDFHASENWSIYVRTQYADVRDGNLPNVNFYERLAKSAPRKSQAGSKVTGLVASTPSLNADPEFARETANPPAPESAPQSAPAAKPYSEPYVVVAKVGAANFRSINDALNKVDEGTTIVVRPGLYRESLVLKKSVVIIGEGKREEIILESNTANCINMSTDYAEVRGLTIRLRVGSSAINDYAVDIPKGRLVLEDCDITSDSLSCVGIHGKDADPVLRNCKIHDGKETGALVYENGSGLIEDCEIFANNNAGIEIKEGATPTVRNCKIHDGKSGGVHVYENSSGLIEDCEIFANRLTGIEIKTGGNPTVQNCTISRNLYEAIYVHDEGRGIIENCDLRGNGGKGAFDIRTGCKVEQRNNQE